MPTKGICPIWSKGRLFSPSLSCRGQGIGKHRGTISSWYKRTAGQNLVVHRHGTTLRESVQRYRCRLYFSLFFSHFDIKAGKLCVDGFVLLITKCNSHHTGERRKPPFSKMETYLVFQSILLVHCSIPYRFPRKCFFFAVIVVYRILYRDHHRTRGDAYSGMEVAVLHIFPTFASFYLFL